MFLYELERNLTQNSISCPSGSIIQTAIDLGLPKKTTTFGLAERYLSPEIFVYLTILQHYSKVPIKLGVNHTFPSYEKTIRELNTRTQHSYVIVTHETFVKIKKTITLGDVDTTYNHITNDNTLWLRKKDKTVCITMDTTPRTFTTWLALLPKLLDKQLEPAYKTAELNNIVQAFATYTGNYIDDVCNKLDILVRKIIDLRTIQLTTTIEQFNAKHKASFARTIIDSMEAKINKYNAHMREIEALNVQIKELERQKYVWELSEDKNPIPEDTISRILKINSIVTITTSRDRLNILFRTPITDFDINEYQRLQTTKSMNMYKNTKLQKLFNALFVDFTHTIFGMYRTEITLNSCSFRPGSVDLVGTDKQYNDGVTIIHPHLEQHHCYGDNATNITKALKQNDLLTALYYCAAAGQSLNIYDGTVQRTFMKLITRHPNKQCMLDNATNEMINIQEFCQFTPEDIDEITQRGDF